VRPADLVRPTVARAELLFTSVQRVRSFDGVVDQIRGAILRGDVEPGGRLPAERELSTQLGVSRTTLREGLRALESQGLVEIRLGSSGGIFAAIPDGQMVGAALDAMMQLRHASRWEMQEYRRDFEPQNAALAALRATEEDLERLQRAVAVFNEAVADEFGDDSRCIRLKCDVHERVADCTHNAVRASMMVALSQAIIRDAEDRRGAVDRSALTRAATDFDVLFSAIRNADAISAGSVMSQRLIWI